MIILKQNLFSVVRHLSDSEGKKGIHDLHPHDQKALQLSFTAHKDQLDKSGIPYVYHPFHVAEQMETEDTVDDKALERIWKYEKAIRLLEG